MKNYRLKIISFILFLTVFNIFFMKISAQPDEVRLIVEEAEKLIKEKRLYRDAIKKLELAIKKDPTYAPAYLNMGRAYHFQEDYSTAIKYYKKAVELDKSCGEACYNIGSSYASLKDNETAIKWLVKSKEIFCSTGQFDRYKRTLDKLIQYSSGSQKKNFQKELDNYPPVIIKTPVAIMTPTVFSPTPLPVDEGVVLVPGGKFFMGSDERAINEAIKVSRKYGDEANRSWFSDELPGHEVYLDNFYIDKYEVTNQQFTEFILATGYKTDAEKEGFGYTIAWDGKTILKEVYGADWQHPSGRESNISGKMDYPVVQVSWNDATAYASWAGKKLPSEAKWEKASRGTDKRLYPWGNDWNDNYCNNWNLNIFYLMDFMPDFFNGRGILPVGKISVGASPYGVMDMSGNTWEWCSDWYCEDYYSKSPLSNPMGPENGDTRVLRGGPWYYINPVYFRTAARFGLNPKFRSFFIGFRCISL